MIAYHGVGGTPWQIVTNPRIFDPATPLEVAVSFCEKLLDRPRAVPIQPSRRHGSILIDLLGRTEIRGAGVSQG